MATLEKCKHLFMLILSPSNQRRNELTEHWRNVKETANITKKVFLSLSDFFCFVYLGFVNLWDEFLFSTLVEIYDIFVE